MHNSYQFAFDSADFAHLATITLTGAAGLPGRGDREGGFGGHRETRRVVTGLAGAGTGAGSSA